MVTTYPSADTKADLPLKDIPENIYDSGNVYAVPARVHKQTSQSSAVADRVSLAEYCLERAKQYLAKDDPMQASEKLYKATEESIKFLAEFNHLIEVQEAKSQGQWWNKLLDRASMSLTKKTGKKIIEDTWGKAYRAHVFGFHENAYSLDEVQSVIPLVEKLVKYVREVSDAGRKDNP